MKYKASIILKTNRINENTSYSDWLTYSNWDNPILDTEYKHLVKQCFKNTSSFIEPTLKSFAYSDIPSSDYEVIIVHRNPEVIYDSVKKYTNLLDMNIKLIKEKHSPWHDIKGKYPTLCNAVNTGVIWADGEMLISTDDCMLYPKHLIKELSVRLTQPVGITYSFTNKPNQIINDEWKDIGINDGIVKEVYKTSMMRQHIAYGYCFNIPLRHILVLNGFNEDMDGAMFEDEGEFAERYATRFEVNRYPINTYVYMFGHNYDNVNNNPYKLRNNHVWKNVISRYYKANTVRPSKIMCEDYEIWHRTRYKSFDENFDICQSIPTFNLRELNLNRHQYSSKQVGERLL